MSLAFRFLCIKKIMNLTSVQLYILIKFFYKFILLIYKSTKKSLINREIKYELFLYPNIILVRVVFIFLILSLLFLIFKPGGVIQI